MKKVVSLVTLATIMVYLLSVSMGSVEALHNGAAENVTLGADNLVLVKGTSIPVELTEEVSSKRNKLGDTVYFQITHDVLVEDVIVIPAKTQGKAVVTKVKQAGCRDKDGQIEVIVDNVEAAGGNIIPVRGKIQELGGKQNFFIKFSLAGFLIKGKEAKLSQGRKFLLIVAEDVRLDGKTRD
jgi:hypothetical protein